MLKLSKKSWVFVFVFMAIFTIGFAVGYLAMTSKTYKDPKNNQNFWQILSPF